MRIFICKLFAVVVWMLFCRAFIDPEVFSSSPQPHSPKEPTVTEIKTSYLLDNPTGIPLNSPDFHIRLPLMLTIINSSVVIRKESRYSSVFASD